MGQERRRPGKVQAGKARHGGGRGGAAATGEERGVGGLGEFASEEEEGVPAGSLGVLQWQLRVNNTKLRGLFDVQRGAFRKI